GSLHARRRALALRAPAGTGRRERPGLRPRRSVSAFHGTAAAGEGRAEQADRDQHREGTADGYPARSAGGGGVERGRLPEAPAPAARLQGLPAQGAAVRAPALQEPRPRAEGRSVSFILDTCALSELTRPAPDRKVAAWFDAQGPRGSVPERSHRRRDREEHRRPPRGSQKDRPRQLARNAV